MAKQPKADPFAQFERINQQQLAKLATMTGERPPGWLDFPEWLPKVSPRWTWDWPHQQFLYRILERIPNGECRRLIVSMPPRHSKSETITVRFSAWWLEQHPEKHVIIAAHTQKLANKFSRSARSIARERIQLSRERWAAAEWLTEQGGGFAATGIGAGLTGFGGDLIVIDDPIRSVEEAENPEFREKQWDWFNEVLRKRAEPGATIVVIATRWHADDLSGRLMEQEQNGGEHWEVVNLPALAEEDDPMGRQPGVALCPARYDQAALLAEQKADPHGFAAQYQGRPVARERLLFDCSLFKVIARKDLPAGIVWFRYWDLAGSLKKRASYSASAGLGIGPDGNLYIRDMVRVRLEWPDMIKLLILVMRFDRTANHGIERTLHGLAACQELMRESKVAHVPIEAVPVDKDKYTRALPVARWLREGKVFLVRENHLAAHIETLLVGNGEAAREMKLIFGEWVPEWLRELAVKMLTWIQDLMVELSQFPAGTYTDQVDTLSGGLLMAGDFTGFEIGQSEESPLDGEGSIW